MTGNTWRVNRGPIGYLLAFGAGFGTAVILDWLELHGWLL